MDTAYFSKVTKSMSWKDLNNNITTQKNNNCKPLPYNTIIEITISSNDFDELTQILCKPNKCYIAYTPLSIASSNGIWNCILLNSACDSRALLLYTSGKIYPLYASILDE